MPAKPLTPAQIIDRAFARREQLADLEAEQAADLSTIIALGPGKHSGEGEGHELQVIAASYGSASTVYHELEETKEAEEKAREIAGEHFAKLFDRVVCFRPAQGFADIARVLLTPAKLRDILLLCIRTRGGSSGRKAYITWPKPTKS